MAVIGFLLWSLGVAVNEQDWLAAIIRTSTVFLYMTSLLSLWVAGQMNRERADLRDRIVKHYVEHHHMTVRQATEMFSSEHP